MKNSLRVLRVACLSSILLTASCADDVTTKPLWSDIDTRNFNTMPHPNDLDFTQFTIVEEVDYWELRFAIPEYYSGATSSTETVEVLGAVGTKCAGAPEPDSCREMLAKTTAIENRGFWTGCYPGECYKYIVSTSQEVIETWTTSRDLQRFLGKIDTPEEAVFLANISNYYWETSDKEFGGIREIKEGFQIIALRGSKTCGKLERFLLLVHSEGNIEVQRAQVAIEHHDPNKRFCPMP